MKQTTKDFLRTSPDGVITNKNLISEINQEKTNGEDFSAKIKRGHKTTDLPVEGQKPYDPQVLTVDIETAYRPITIDNAEEITAYAREELAKLQEQFAKEYPDELSDFGNNFDYASIEAMHNRMIS